jgi:hypothetical protein
MLRLGASMVLCVLISVIFAAPVFAVDSGLSLPATFIRIEVTDGNLSYFDTMLHDVPSGYDVTNATYRGWCVDVRTEMARSPATHEVFLYSSLNPPRELASESWDMINYVLNHKEGSVQDIQQAIWYFMRMDGQYNPSSVKAWALINDALENGAGFVPGHGEVTAVICYPTILFPNQPDVQISIIEVEVERVTVGEYSSSFAVTSIMLTASLVGLVFKRKRRMTRQSVRTF